MMLMMHKKRKQKGFTIIEILIAIVILVVGILGILAIFPRAIQSATKTIEDTYAGIIAQSVMDSVKVGIRETKIVTTSGKKLFLLNHDGVTTDFDSIRNIEEINSPGQIDALIYLPGAGQDSHFYIYPQTLQGTSLDSTNAVDNRSTLEGDPVHIERIYAFGDRVGPGPTQLTGASFLQEQINSGSAQEKAAAKNDPYLSYGFNLIVSKSSIQNTVSDDLYMVMVYVYRNFLAIKGHDSNKPLRKMRSLVAF